MALCLCILMLVAAMIPSESMSQTLNKPQFINAFDDDDMANMNGEYVAESCTPSFFELTSSLGSEIQCREPRPTVVSLYSDQTRILYPPAVIVNRCSSSTGHCSNKKSCVAIETHRVNRTVRWYSALGRTRKPTCGHIEVVEDLRCGCSCSIKPSDCSPNQSYSKRLCSCTCGEDGPAMMRACLQRGGLQDAKMMWNHRECQCECHHMGVCSTGFEWVPKFCRCMRVTMENPSPPTESESSSSVAENSSAEEEETYTSSTENELRVEEEASGDDDTDDE